MLTSNSKFLDHHLKPYRCKIKTCPDLCFASTACLLRHEREAHAMHGHGPKPFLCSYAGCDRGIPGNGFPRHWNLADHQKRVHNDNGRPKSPSPRPSTRKRKIEEDSVLAEKIDRSWMPMVKKAREDKSLSEKYGENHLLLFEIVEKLRDPRCEGNMDLLRQANACIKVMVQTVQRIKGESVSRI